MGFVHEYIYQGYEYLACTVHMLYMYIWEVRSLDLSYTQDCLSSPKYICDQVWQAMLTSF